GTIGEEVAIETLRNGATDYVLKQRLARLGPAVRRALTESRERVERRELEQRLFQAQKMEVAGRLAAGVAHDFNNLLTVINGYSDLLWSKTTDAGHLSDLREIRDAGERARSLTQRLLSFSRQRPKSYSVVDLNTVIGELVHMLSGLIGESVRIAQAPSAEPLWIEADRTELEQVVLNL